MRSRNIKPGFFTNEKLAECSPMARLLFAGLPMLCDRDGRMEYRPLRIKAELFPYESSTVQAPVSHRSSTVQVWCDELLRFGDDFIIIYEVDGVKYLQVTNFVKHQNCHRDEKSRQLPPPPALTTEHHSSTVVAPCQHRSSTVALRLNAECGMLNEDIPKPGAAAPEEKPSDWQASLQQTQADIEAAEPPPADRSPRRGFKHDPDNHAQCVAVPSSLSTPAFHAAWMEWHVARAEAGEPVTMSVAREAINRMEQWGARRAIAALRYSFPYKNVIEERGASPAAPIPPVHEPPKVGVVRYKI
jgi:hypothetical protein